MLVSNMHVIGYKFSFKRMLDEKEDYFFLIFQLLDIRIIY